MAQLYPVVKSHLPPHFKVSGAAAEVQMVGATVRPSLIATLAAHESRGAQYQGMTVNLL